MSVLVTGGSGFTGGYVIPRLVAAGHDVVALARSETAAARVEALGAKPIYGDLDDATAIDDAFSASGADALVNLASLGFGHAPLIIAAAEDAGIQRAVFVSTTAIFTTLNAPSKAVRIAAEDAIRESALDWTIVRPTMIYGAPGDRNMWRLLQFLRRSPIVPLPDGGRRLQQPVHVDDLAAAIVTALDADVAIGCSYDVAGPDALTFRAIVEQAGRSIGRFPKLVPFPARPAVLAVEAAERVGAAGPIKAEQIERLLEDKAFDISDAQRDLGYDPRPFFVGVYDEAQELRGDYTLLQKPGLYARTVVHIPPKQLAHRVRLRAQKAALAKWPGPFEQRWRGRPASCHWPPDFEAIDLKVSAGCPSPGDNAKGVFEFLNDRRDLGQPIDWRPADVPQLWRYNLHYWEWAWPLVTHPDREWARQAFADLWRSWKAGTIFGRWDEWSPYVASLRAWVMCNVFHPLVASTELEREFLDDLALHAGFVAANLEFDVGGNHLIKNLKACIALGIFFGDDEGPRVGLSALASQIRSQILDDGGHFELAPTYHAQVLADLIDISQLLRAVDIATDAALGDPIEQMRAWLRAMLMPDGDVPLFGDSVPIGAERLAAIGVSSVGMPRLSVLEASGYVVVRASAGMQLVADVGVLCPPELPAHGHADCLSFHLAVGGRRVLVDPGVSTYEPGSTRAWERATRAHNTVCVDSINQSEVWGVFRAARLARAHLGCAVDDGEAVTVAGWHEGYCALAGSPVHRRVWRVRASSVAIVDQVSAIAGHTHTMTTCYTVEEGLPISVSGTTAIIGPVRFQVTAGDNCQVHLRCVLPSRTSPRGRLSPNMLLLYVSASAPASWETEIVF